MKKTRKELEAELDAKSKAVIRELPDWNAAHATSDLAQIEDIVLELREKLSQAMVAGVVASQEQVHPAEVRGPQCGQVMRCSGHSGFHALARHILAGVLLQMELVALPGDPAKKNGQASGFQTGVIVAGDQLRPSQTALDRALQECASVNFVFAQRN